MQTRKTRAAQHDLFAASPPVARPESAATASVGAFGALLGTFQNTGADPDKQRCRQARGTKRTEPIPPPRFSHTLRRPVGVCEAVGATRIKAAQPSATTAKPAGIA